MDTNPTPAETLRGLIEPLLPRIHDEVMRDRITKLLSAPPQGTLRAFMREAHGQSVTTLQVSRLSGSLWAPTGRTVDAHSSASSVTLGDSRRHYSGMRVVARDGDSLAVMSEAAAVIYLVEHSGLGA